MNKSDEVRRELSLLGIGLGLFLLMSTGCIGDRAFFRDPRLPGELNKISFEVEVEGAGLEDLNRRIRNAYGEPSVTSDDVATWKIDEATLISDPVAGVYYVTPDAELIRIYRCQNPLRLALVGRYEMVTLATDYHSYQSCWLGDVELRMNGTYRFTDSGGYLDQRADQRDNFFMLHPSGAYQLTFGAGLNGESTLESIHLTRRLADITFRSSDGAETSFGIVKRALSGQIEMRSDSPVPFEISTRWNQRRG